MKMLVIADDFTGANDTGVQLAKKGARTDVLLLDKPSGNVNADVLVLNTESRACDAATAAQRLENAFAGLGELPASLLVYKKIDSTFRGNVGAEIAATMKITGARLAIVAAAIPVAGRVTLNGHCQVHGVPLHKTEFASDPKTPVTTSHVSELLAQQTNLPIHELHLEVIRSPLLQSRLAQIAEKERAILVMDAQNEEDLDAIARAVTSLSCRYILAGAAGLANALPTSLYLTAKVDLPLLVVAGSMSEATRRQIEALSQQNNLSVVDIDVETLIGPVATQSIAELSERSAAVLRQQKHCVLRTCRDERDRARIDSLCQQWRMTRAELGETISRRMGELTLAILSQAKIGGLFLTGGDIATAVAGALNAKGYRITGEIAPCIPWGTFTQSDIDDLPVITKAGGFGGENTLREAIWFIEEMYSVKE